MAGFKCQKMTKRDVMHLGAEFRKIDSNLEIIDNALDCIVEARNNIYKILECSESCTESSLLEVDMLLADKIIKLDEMPLQKGLLSLKK